MAECYSNATSQVLATLFLDKVIKKYPFKVSSIKVDGGSEFRQCFEKACQEKSIEFHLLPLKSPQFNGGVEHSNRTLKEDLYSQPCFADSIGAFRVLLNKAIKKYNHYRPHQDLKGLTSFEYTKQLLETSS